MTKFLIRDAKTHERLGYSDGNSKSPVVGDDGIGRVYSRDAVVIDAYCPEDRAEIDKWIANR